jgi:predicted ATPase
MQDVNVDRLFVVTGGPGSGKRTLLAAVGRRGIQTMPEADDRDVFGIGV